MEWQQLEYFQTLARLQHVTRAAETLSITQPALSKSIARLEEDIGAPLFERRGRSIKINRYGQIFLSHVDRILKEFDRANKEIHDLIHPEHGEVAIGFTHTLSGLIPDLISAFRVQFPMIRLQLNQNYSYPLLDKLFSGDLDICLIPEPAEPQIPIQWMPLWTEELYITLSADHPLAGAESIQLDEIINESFIFFKTGFTIRETTDRLFHQTGVSPNVAFEGEEVTTVAGLVAAGLGVSILPDTGLDNRKIVQIRLSEPRCQRVIGMASIEGQYESPVTSRFKKFVSEQYAPRMEKV
ncbi:LysR family transcriptional regulator (plasmid) [Alicyclobacillus fastidiosus]|uniref:LysR family transcriptional regulator n=1 Tax=Alicyclobacillus fastidiosus TaxID=392011 RepID=A0ABY6ZS79_9BACL|nr:LysR family transcriptional regulator [Alicyclobacillus fastidiosus]WAH44939.1 LysR family transcriptional regulator [Alicyclobacillus fastidiosus]GMA65592.1 putative HTH-type transcriptional regulator YybE [Alicyclobacillus fastidiosus]GMA65708.1 putative HTH-type transcriptional regulator YybE [Alicyclobacillus fastidiosus]